MNLLHSSNINSLYIYSKPYLNRFVYVQKKWAFCLNIFQDAKVMHFVKIFCLVVLKWLLSNSVVALKWLLLNGYSEMVDLK